MGNTSAKPLPGCVKSVPEKLPLMGIFNDQWGFGQRVVRAVGDAKSPDVWIQLLEHSDNCTGRTIKSSLSEIYDWGQSSVKLERSQSLNEYSLPQGCTINNNRNLCVSLSQVPAFLTLCGADRNDEFATSLIPYHAAVAPSNLTRFVPVAEKYSYKHSDGTDIVLQVICHVEVDFQYSFVYGRVESSGGRGLSHTGRFIVDKQNGWAYPVTQTTSPSIYYGHCKPHSDSYQYFGKVSSPIPSSPDRSLYISVRTGTKHQLETITLSSSSSGVVSWRCPPPGSFSTFTAFYKGVSYWFRLSTEIWDLRGLLFITSFLGFDIKTRLISTVNGLSTFIIDSTRGIISVKGSDDYMTLGTLRIPIHRHHLAVVAPDVSFAKSGTSPNMVCSRCGSLLIGTVTHGLKLSYTLKNSSECLISALPGSSYPRFKIFPVDITYSRTGVGFLYSGDIVWDTHTGGVYPTITSGSLGTTSLYSRKNLFTRNDGSGNDNSMSLKFSHWEGGLSTRDLRISLSLSTSGINEDTKLLFVLNSVDCDAL